MSRILIDTDWLRAAVESSRTLTSIADEPGVGRATVSRAAKAAGIVVPRRPPPTTRRKPHARLDDSEWLAAAYANRTMTDIAGELDVSRSTVAAALQRHGIALRTKAAAGTLARPAQLHDADWLSARYETSRTPSTAATPSPRSADSTTSPTAPLR